jgi:hypothetical protein
MVVASWPSSSSSFFEQTLKSSFSSSSAEMLDA